MKKNFLMCVLLGLVFQLAAQKDQNIVVFKSPNQQYSIVVQEESLPDLVRKIEYRLVDVLREDTIKLMTVLRHDLPAPVIFWVGENRLLYERHNFGDAPSIVLRNLLTNEEWSTEGFLPVQAAQSKNFLDTQNEVLIYFKPGAESDGFKTSLWKLELQGRKVEKLYTFNANFDFDYPVVNMNHNDRTLSFQYWEAQGSDMVEHEVKIDY